MKSYPSLKPFLWTVLMISLSGEIACAQTSTTTLSPADAKTLEDGRSVTRVVALWNTPLDWKENNSSMAQIIAHIKKSLGNKAPAIEVRGTETNRSTFELTQAPLGPTLSSVAELANFQVWVFPGRLLLSSKEALTPGERATIAQRVCGEWKFGLTSNASGSNWNKQEMFNRAVFAVIGTEVKKRLAAKGVTIPAPPPWERHVAGKPDLPAYELPVGELSDSSRQLLQELLNIPPSYTDARWQPPVLNATDLVTFDDTNQWSRDLRIRKAQVGQSALGSWTVKPPR